MKIKKMFSKDGKRFYYFSFLLAFSIINIFIDKKVSKDGKK